MSYFNVELAPDIWLGDNHQSEHQADARYFSIFAESAAEAEDFFGKFVGPLMALNQFGTGFNLPKVQSVPINGATAQAELSPFEKIGDWTGSIQVKRIIIETGDAPHRTPISCKHIWAEATEVEKTRIVELRPFQPAAPRGVARDLAKEFVALF